MDNARARHAKTNTHTHTHNDFSRSRRSQSAFEYLLLIGGGVLFVILAVAVVRTAINTNSNSANNTAGGYQNYIIGQSDRTITSAAIKPACVAYWPFSEGTGTTTADVRGNGNTGTLTNSPTWTTGIVGNGLSFEGVYPYVDVGNGASLTPNTQDFTLIAWIKTTGSGGSARHVAGKRDGGVNWYRFYLTGSNYIYFEMASGVAVSTSTFTDNAWHQLVGVRKYASDTSYLYVDGVLQATGQGQFAITPTGNFTIGRWSSENAFNGTIDEVSLYNRSLTKAEIACLYANKESGCT